MYGDALYGRGRRFPCGFFTGMAGSRCSPRCLCMRAGCTSSATWSICGPLAARSKTRWAHARYVVFYLAGGVVAMLAQVAGRVRVRRIPTSGRERRDCGGDGRVHRHLSARPHPVRVLFIFIFFRVTFIPAALLIGFWFLIQLFNCRDGGAGARRAGVAYLAHVGGFSVWRGDGAAVSRTRKGFGYRTRDFQISTPRLEESRPRGRTPLQLDGSALARTLPLRRSPTPLRPCGPGGRSREC